MGIRDGAETIGDLATMVQRMKNNGGGSEVLGEPPAEAIHFISTKREASGLSSKG